MSIKEALERGSAKRERGDEWAYASERDGKVYHFKHADWRYSYIVEDKSYALLRKARVRELLEETAEILNRDFNDVEIEESRLWNGSERLISVRWDRNTHRDWVGGTNGSIGQVKHHKFLGVGGLPLTNELLVIGKGKELLTEEQWTDFKLLEDAIVRGLKHPLLRSGW